MAVPVRLKDVTKKYGDKVVIPDLSLEIEEGEFFTLLGPSGCGKTTLLRMIAGFNEITSGTIAFGDQVINRIPPAKRNIGMVFQNYAIFPNMTVRGNIEFGLKNRGLSRAQIAERTERIMATVHIEEFADRMPKDLSGGQQQRVALARAIVIEPQILLMDEPLSNLDAQLRVDMRNAIREIQREVGITTVYVTHDQEEAMAVSDRLAVMRSGVIQQVDAPRIVYGRPANEFVAGFIGRTNFLRGAVVDAVSRQELAFPQAGYAVPLADRVRAGEVVASVRPQHLSLARTGPGLPGTVSLTTFLGESMHCRVVLDDGTTLDAALDPISSEVFDEGERVFVGVAPHAVTLLDAESRTNLRADVGRGDGS